MRILDQSEKIARSLFNPRSAREQQYYLYSFIYHRNKLLAVGQNSYVPTSRILHLANKFNVQKFKEHKMLHSETDAISRLWGEVYIDSRLILVNVRIKRDGTLAMSMPCKDCQKIIRPLGIRVFYTNEQGEFIKME